MSNTANVENVGSINNPPGCLSLELLTSSGALVPVGLMIKMFQLMSSWVKANGASRECPSLAMRCVILALSETWTLNLIEKCGQKSMKTPNGHNKVFHGPVLDHQPHVPNRPQPIPRLGTQLTWKVNCGPTELKLKLKIRETEHVLFFPGRSQQKNMEV